MLPKTFLALTAGMVLLTGAAYAAGDAEAGKQVFRQCALCHTTEAGKNKVGPSLFGIVGRDSASIETFNYSDAMKSFKQKWTAEELNVYLQDPRKVVPGTKMIFVGVKDDKQRQDVIEYLQTLK